MGPEGADGEAQLRRESSSPGALERRRFRVVTEEFPDRIEVRVEEQEWFPNFGWVTRGDPSAFPRWRVSLRRQPGWLTRLLWCLRPDREDAEAAFYARYRQRLEKALVAAQVEANRRNEERQLIMRHLESVRDVLDPADQ